MSEFYIPIFEDVAATAGEAARTYGAIVDMMPDEASETFASHARIAERAGQSIRTTGNHLRELVASGWIVDKGRLRGRRTHNYAIRSTNLRDADGNFSQPARKSELKQRSHWRFPVTTVHLVTEWSQVLVLAYLVWKCDQRDVTSLTGESLGTWQGRGYYHLSRRLSLTIDQSRRAVQSLAAKGVISYSAKDALAFLPPKGTSWRHCPTMPEQSDRGVQCRVAGSPTVASVAEDRGVCCGAAVASAAEDRGVQCSCIYEKPIDLKPDESKPHDPKPTARGSCSRRGGKEIKNPDESKQLCERFVLEIEAFKDLHEIIDVKVQELIVAIVLTYWSGNSHVRQLCEQDNGRHGDPFLYLRNEIVNQVLTEDGFTMDGIRVPHMLLRTILQKFDSQQGTKVWPSVSRQLQNARFLLQAICALCEQLSGVHYPARRKCNYCDKAFHEKRVDGIWQQVDSAGLPACSVCRSKIAAKQITEKHKLPRSRGDEANLAYLIAQHGG